MPKILLLKLTNNACDTLEERLQQYIHVLDEAEDVWMKFVPISWNISGDEHDPTRARLSDNHYDLPLHACYGKCKDFINLCTLGSVFKGLLFQGWNTGGQCVSTQWYQFLAPTVI